MRKFLIMTGLGFGLALGGGLFYLLTTNAIALMVFFGLTMFVLGCVVVGVALLVNNRQWTRNYKVKLALATNPKTPQPTAMKFVNFLQDSDLRSIVKSKDVPTAISTHARRILMKKGKL